MEEIARNEDSNRALRAQIRTLRYGLVCAYRGLELIPYNSHTEQQIDNIRFDLENIFKEVGMKVKE
mgnify:CR=1 FL=1